MSQHNFGIKDTYSRPSTRYEGTSGNACTAIRFLNLGTRGSWVASFTLRRLYSGERALDTNWIGGCVGPIVGLDAVKTKISLTKIMCRTDNWNAAERNTSKVRLLWNVAVIIVGEGRCQRFWGTCLLHHQDHDTGSGFLWNFGTHLPDYTVSYPKTRLLFNL
jgi:hypothetical protein